MAASDSAGKPANTNEDTLPGFLFALTAYLLWGVLPLYLHEVGHIPAAEVVAHRIIWSLPIAGLVLVAIGRTADVRKAIMNPAMLGMACITAAFVTVNWSIYVYAIGSGHALEGALGYYINPLISVVIGALLLGERLRGPQMIAIGLAAIAVAILAYDAGGLPWISLGLAFSWGFYAYFRKTLPIGPNQGFFLEVLILTIPALAYIIYAESTGSGHFLTGLSNNDTWLLLFSGVATAVPLMIYANGAKRLKLSTIGIMQYIAPTMVFVIAVFVFDEPFGNTKLVAFCLIWAALAVYSLPMLFRRPAKA
ncbi:EamA family transporter RarD [Rhizobium sp. KVB221]|uniref:EamA family transporter RarD n=1 Tax=Rhizobium setariae TaxID=2801340 RepID=A0A936YLZ8_9HYPH|nr:EamA family transporter RarD [Rhizobium setariae]MBL0371192.1 EamA family transporter RarD [Rhizobium setariae]